ncbi:hypothetical protein PENSPDRAFT_69513 [Peniophora sp. CONT]|nr:hypothetical protein PENSPDRAFT_69513 [Peniophora sp. CONT]
MLMETMPMDLELACIAQRLNQDCLALIFHENVLVKDLLCLYDTNWTWPETRDNSLRYTIEEALLYRGRALIRLSHVCRRWREVALGMSSLWASLVAQSEDLYPKGGYESILKQSRDSPLSFVRPDDLLDSYMEIQLVEKLDRYETIMFSNESLEWSQFFSGKTAARLRTVVFITESHEDLPQNLLELAPLQIPIATHLALDGFYIPFIAPQLTCLVITLRDAYLSSNDLCDILLQTPLLESLNFIQYNPAPGGHWPSDDIDRRRISLPHLVLLKVWGSVLDLSSLLLRLDTPKDITIDLTTYMVQNLDGFTQFVSTLLPYAVNPSYDHLTVCDCHEAAEGIDDPPLFSLRQGLDGPRKLSIRVNASYEDVVPLYRLAFERLTPGQVRMMSIEQPILDIASLFLPDDVNQVFHHDVFNKHVEELRYDTHMTMVGSYEFNNGRRWGNGLIPDFLLHHPEMYPTLRRITVSGASRDSPWPLEPQLLGMRAWLDSRAQVGISLDSLQLEGHVPETATRSLVGLGDGVPIVDNRQNIPAAPLRTRKITSSSSSDSDEFYALFARHNTFM